MTLDPTRVNSFNGKYIKGDRDRMNIEISAPLTGGPTKLFFYSATQEDFNVKIRPLLANWLQAPLTKSGNFHTLAIRSESGSFLLECAVTHDMCIQLCEVCISLIRSGTLL